MTENDKFRNKADEVAGRAKEEFGDATDNESLQAEGKTQRTKGSLKQAGEKIKDAFKK